MGNKGKNLGLLFGVFVVVGIGVVAIGFSETTFPDIIPFALILERECNFNTIGFGEVSFGDIECNQRFNSFRTSDLPFSFVLPLSGVDTNSPMILDYNFDPSFPSAECLPFVTDITTLTLTDENGSIIFVGDETITDIQPLLLPDQQALIVSFDDTTVGICPTQDIRYVGGGGCNCLTFLQRPPEIEEFTDPLLEQWLYLADFRDQGVIETSQRFAVAESFQLVDPTVITGLRARVGSDLSSALQDASTSVTAFVWNLDETPPKRVVQSAETFVGLKPSRPELDLDFTFPNAVVLLAVENNQQVTYGVGISVTQNVGQEFVYMQANQTANTHECVIDRNSLADSESMFVPNGICGFDIFHNQFKAFQILQALPDIDDPNLGDPSLSITQTELIRILCEGLEPEPDICQIQPTPDQCGITEIFFNGECICAPTFDRNAQGDCEITEKNLLPDLLQIAEFSFLLLVVIGGIIIVIGIIGIIVRSRR